MIGIFEVFLLPHIISIVLCFRMFMLTTPSNGECVRVAAHPKLVLVKISIIKENSILISAPEMKDYSFTLDYLYSLPTQVTRVWEQNVHTIDCGDKIAEWFSQYIFGTDDSFRLMFYPHSIPTKPGHPSNFVFNLLRPVDTVTACFYLTHKI